MGDQEMQTAQRLGQWGFTFTPPLAPFEQQVLRTSVPSYLACRWNIDVTSSVYSSGGISAGFPPRNQTDSRARAYKLRVTFGTEGATEEVVVDYPAQGGCFGVRGANVAVSVTGGAPEVGVPQTTLGGFLTPGGNAGVTMPTFTTAPVTIAALASNTFPVPQRACGYRLMFVDGSSPSFAALSRIEQIGGSFVSGVVTTDHTQPNDGAPFAGDALPTSRAQFFPLHPAAQFVRPVNNDAVNPITLGLQFLLRLD